MPAKRQGRRVCGLLEPLSSDSREIRVEKIDACTIIWDLIDVLTAQNPMFGFTYEVERQAILFTCSHPGRYQIRIGRTLGSHRRTEGHKNALATVMAKHPQTCPEARGRR